MEKKSLASLEKFPLKQEHDFAVFIFDLGEKPSQCHCTRSGLLRSRGLQLGVGAAYPSQMDRGLHVSGTLPEDWEDGSGCGVRPHYLHSGPEKSRG